MLSKLKLLFSVLIILACFLLPETVLALDNEAGKTQKIEGFEVVTDVSLSMDSDWKTGNCKDIDKQELQLGLIKRFCDSIPQLNYVAALRVMGLKSQFSVNKDEKASYLVYEPQKFDRPSFQDAAHKLKASNGSTPMGPVMVEVATDLDGIAGSKAVIIISDFKKSADFGDPAAEAAKVRDAYGNPVPVYTIGITSNPKDIATAKAISAASGHGQYFDGCSLYKDQAALDEAIRIIFYDVYTDGDADGDGVSDSMDKCPDTPKGALVDYRGCWVVAYGTFFDFDKSVVKEGHLPHLQREAEVLKAYPKLVVSIDGHTDKVGTPEYNMKLGKERALAVRQALISFGVEESRLKYQSFGETMPIGDNNTDEGRAKNRRVELTVSQP